VCVCVCVCVCVFVCFVLLISVVITTVPLLITDPKAVLHLQKLGAPTHESMRRAEIERSLFSVTIAIYVCADVDRCCCCCCCCCLLCRRCMHRRRRRQTRPKSRWRTSPNRCPTMSSSKFRKQPHAQSALFRCCDTHLHTS
jgi:hypothetical protein